MLLQVTESWKLFCIWGRLVYWHVEIDLYLTVENWLFISVFIFMCINLCSLNCNKTTNSNLLILRKFHCNVLMKKKEYTLAGLLRQLWMNCRASGSIPSPSCMLECPWARHRIPHCVIWIKCQMNVCHCKEIPPQAKQSACCISVWDGWGDGVCVVIRDGGGMVIYVNIGPAVLIQASTAEVGEDGGGRTGWNAGVGVLIW